MLDAHEQLNLSDQPDDAAESASDFWQVMEAKISLGEAQIIDIVEQENADLWQVLEFRLDPSQYKPARRVVYELVEDKYKEGEKETTVFYLRVENAYLRIGEPQLFVWNLLDGTHSLRDIMTAYRQKYNKIAFPVITGALNTFRACGMLQEPTESLFDRAMRRLSEKSGKAFKFNPYFFLSKHKAAYDKLDSKVDWAYRHGLKLLFEPSIGLTLTLFSLLGCVVMLYITVSGHPIMAKMGEAGAGGYALISYATFLPVVFVHEMMHALAVKHYGRRILGGGLMLLRGLPSFYVDATDMWMDRNKWHRITVSLVGPLANYFFSAVLTMIVLISPGELWSVALFTLAINNAVTGTLNLLPLIELDGYYAIQDWLGETGMRGKAMKFFKQEFLGAKRWKKFWELRGRDLFYTLYGAAVWLFTAVLGLAFVTVGVLISLTNAITLTLALSLSAVITVYMMRDMWIGIFVRKPNKEISR